MSSPTSPCAACKFLRRKCTEECPFAPYFPPDEPKKFANVHKVFGASNVAKLIHELDPPHREDAVKSLAYEAEARLRDPVYGCVGLISILQQRLKQIQTDLYNAKRELAAYTGSRQSQSPNFPVLQQGSNIFAIGSNSSGSSSSAITPLMGFNIAPQQQQHQINEPQQLAAVLATRQQREMTRTSYEQITNNYFSFNSSSVNSTGINHIGNISSTSIGNTISPSLALRGFGSSSYQIHHQSAQVLFRSSQQDEAKPVLALQNPEDWK